MKQVPLVFVLMSKRRKQDYIAVLEKVLEVMDEAPVVGGFMMDFDAGLWQALRQVFSGTKLKGCVFHWTQAVMRKVAEVGLKVTYEKREGVHHTIRKLLALPFLPGAHITRAFERLRETVTDRTPAMSQLFSYVEDTWLGNSLWAPEEWSIYRQNVRTNNDVEGWHRSINRNGGRGGMSFYVLLKLLLEEGKMVTLTWQLVSESALTRHRRPGHVHLDEKIMAAWDGYDRREMTCEDFLRQVGETYTVSV